MLNNAVIVKWQAEDGQIHLHLWIHDETGRYVGNTNLLIGRTMFDRMGAELERIDFEALNNPLF